LTAIQRDKPGSNKNPIRPDKIWYYY